MTSPYHGILCLHQHCLLRQHNTEGLWNASDPEPVKAKGKGNYQFEVLNAGGMGRARAVFTQGWNRIESVEKKKHRLIHVGRRRRVAPRSCPQGRLAQGLMTAGASWEVGLAGLGQGIPRREGVMHQSQHKAGVLCCESSKA